MRVQKLTTRLHRGLCIVLAMLMVTALIPFGAFAEENWSEAFQKEKIDTLQKEVVPYANQALGDAFAFSFTGYTLPEGIDLSGEPEYTPDTLPTGTLSVTVIHSSGEVVEGDEPLPNQPVDITLPAGAYTVAFSTLAEGQHIKNTSGLSTDEPLVIRKDSTTAVSYVLTSEAPAPAAPNLNDYITGMTLSVNGGDPVDLTENHELTLKVKVGDNIAVTGTFSIPDPYEKAGFRNETPYAIDLPQALSYASDATSDIIDKDNKLKAGVFSLSASSKTASFIFDKDYPLQRVENMQGEFSYEGTVTPGPNVDGDNVSFTVGSVVIRVPIIHEVPQAKITKSGKVLTNTDSALTRWTVNVQSPEKTFPQGLIVTDKMGLLRDDRPIHQLREVESVEIDGEEIPQGDYTVDPAAGNGFTLTLNKAYDGGTMTIVFTSNLSKDGLKTLIDRDENTNADKDYSIKNVVSVTAHQEGESEGTDWGSAEAKVNNSKASMLKKTFFKQEFIKGDDDGVPYQVWRIFVNQNFMDMDAGAVITDVLPEGLEFVSATAHLYTTEKDGRYTAPSNPTGTNHVEDNDLISIDEGENGTVTFILQRDINVPMYIEVRTKQANDFDAYNLTNKATMEWGGNTFTASASTGTQPSSHLFKNGSDFNLTTRSARWNIFVGGLTETATLTDTLENQTLIAADEDLQKEFEEGVQKYIVIQQLSNASVSHVKENGANPVGKSINLSLTTDGTNSNAIIGGDQSSVTFTASYDAETHNLEIQMDPTNAGKNVYRISFYTRVSDKVIHKNSTAGTEAMRKYSIATITNTAKLKIGDKVYESPEATLSKSELTFDKDSGTYNWADRTVTWTIKANINRLPYQANTFQIIDQLPKGLEYVKDGITVTVDGNKLDDLGYQSECIFSEGDTRLTIRITHPKNLEAFRYPVNVKIVTRLTDVGVNMIYDKNGANCLFQNRAYQGGKDMDGTMRWYGDWEDLNLKGVPVEKKASYQKDSASILWTVHINPKHMAVITPGEGQDIVDIMSVKGLPDGLTSQDLVGFDHTRLTLSRIPQNGSSDGNPIDGTPEVLTLTNVAPGEQPPDTGSYYSFDAEALTLKLHIDTTGHSTNDKYTITYLTPLSVPNNYEGKESVSVENGIEWSGHKKTASVGSISLLSVKASLSTKKFTVLTVYKKDGDNKPLPGAAFTLYRLEEGGSRTPVNSGVTKSDGSLVFNRLKKGDTYVLVETSAPKGYAVSAQAGEGIEIVIPNEGDFIDQTVINEPINGSLQITKTDAETKNPLAGVEFTLYAAGVEKPFAQDGLTNPARTGQDGTVTFDKLPVGSYVVRETGGLPGYVVEAKELTVEIKTTNDAVKKTVTNQLIHGGIQITKVEADSPEQKLEGAEFTLYQRDGVTLYQYEDLVNPAYTDSNGVVTFANLPVGSYVVRETKAPNGYRLDPEPWMQEVSVETHNEIYPFTVENQPVVGKLIVTKMGEDGEGTVLLPGAKFELLAEDKTTVAGAEQETNERGQITFDGLRVGTYYLRETAAPDGYVLSTELLEVQITDAKAEVYLNVTNAKTPPIDVPVTPPPVDVPDTQPPIVDRNDDDDDDGDTRRPIRVVDPTDLTPEEVETLIEDGFVPLSDIPDLTPEMIIDQQIPLADFPEEEIPLAVQPGIPVTGDTTPVALMAVVLLGSVGGLFALNWKPRRKK